MSRSVFARQMTALAKAGWRALTLDEFRNAVRRGDGASAVRDPRPAFLLSFDDGYASLADFAYPFLADLGFTATTFLVTDYVGKANTWDVRYTWERLRHLDWAQIEHWRGRGFDFGSHGATHRRLTWLADGPAAEELARSRDTLRGRLGAAAGRAVAYPFGAVDARIEGLAGAAGYELGFGGVKGDAADPLRLPRLPVYLWDAGRTPLGLRGDAVGALGRAAAHAANRCAVGTSVMLRLAGLAS